MKILATSAFAVRSTYRRTKEKLPGQNFFGQYMILSINHVVDWRYICQHKQTQIEKDVICENTTRINYDYRLGGQVMMRIKTEFKYETLFKGPYEIFQT